MEAKIIYPDGRYPFAATAAYEPGDIVVRPDGSLALYDGLEGCAIGDVISPDPTTAGAIVEWTAGSAATWAAGAKLYRDAGNKLAFTTASTNKPLGASCTAKTAGMVKILINTAAQFV
ncbi:DUF2190 family protein [Aureliella helgolandensis]|uniref:Uncharacterized protein n=1 Tax=Aureliella helgolandensis TaxID=2527968 RepID=A0A518G2V6_9BACT|nr:DUF2190 family protein [Aureliella helgolandensis]QDV22924.1 hypothetical protein Q31a_12170 [Aureliella helgolandensis]